MKTPQSLGGLSRGATFSTDVRAQTQKTLHRGVRLPRNAPDRVLVRIGEATRYSSVSVLSAHLILGWVTQDIASAPHSFDVMLACCCGCEFLTQLTDEYVDDFQFRLVHAAV